MSLKKFSNDTSHSYNPGLSDIDNAEIKSSPSQRHSDTAQRKLLAKIDLRVVPGVCVLFFLAFLDRVNIGNAAIFSLAKDLNLSGLQFNIALAIFFVPYVLFEIPSNILLRRFTPRVWLSVCMFLFGLATIFQGVVSNYSGLLACRFFLGLFEAGIFPGCIYLLGMWYTREEAGLRFSFFSNTTALAVAFGGLLASAIGTMDGLRGYHGWRWIFIIEGCLTCVIAGVLYFCISSFPEQVDWLSKDEKTLLLEKLRREQGSSAIEEPFSWKVVGKVLADPQVLLGGFMFMGLIVPGYGYAYSAPTIIRTLGYGRIQTQLHSIPPAACALVFSLLVGYCSDRARHRFLFALGCMCIGIAGLGTLLNVHDKHKVEYAALFLVSMGVFSAIPIITCWFNLNLAGHRRRSIGSAWQIGFGNVGGFVATFTFTTSDAPYYHRGYSICMGFICLSAVASLLYLVLVWKRNLQQKRDTKAAGLEASGAGHITASYKYGT